MTVQRDPTLDEQRQFISFIEQNLKSKIADAVAKIQEAFLVDEEKINIDVRLRGYHGKNNNEDIAQVKITVSFGSEQIEVKGK